MTVYRSTVAPDMQTMQTSMTTTQTSLGAAETSVAWLMGLDPKVRIATRVLGLIALGGSVDVPITWASAFPSAAYDLDSSVGMTVALATTVTTSTKAKTAAGCTITVTSSGLLAAGAVLIVVGVHKGA